jgi:dTDP-4-dehydrorhamnose 3,5-epimerase-like enzyme
MIKNCNVIDLPKISDSRGNLTFIEQLNHVPFEIKRIYYLYNVPQSDKRGGHAHKKLHQLFIAISGSFDIQLDDGFTKKTVRLNACSQGLYVCPMIWRELYNFSPNAVCMVLASDYYSENDYIRKHADFISSIKKQEIK